MLSYTDFATRLANGQLKNTSAVDKENLGVICPKYNDMILSLTNQGLVDLSVRFPLFMSQVDLTFNPSQNLYNITESNLTGYLQDSIEEPFADDRFVKIHDVFDGNGTRHSMNTDGHILSPSFNTLRFTSSKIDELTIDNESKVRIRYQAKHPTIVETDNINLPPNLVTALQLFVASLYISHMGGEEHSAKGDSYFGAYLRHIGEDETRDSSVTSQVDSNTKFQNRGFV